MADVNRKRHLMFWALAAAGLVLDIASKYAAFAWLGYPANPREVGGELFRLRTAHNTGTFFGMGGETSWSNLALIVFTVLMSALVVYMYLVPPKESAPPFRLYTVALGLVFAGATGNLYDRVVFGFVRDFIDVDFPDFTGIKRWPTFNLADVWLVVGIALYIWALIFMKKAEPGGRAEGASSE
jgi:signal peptidase II